ncbi:MAG: nuclear transport factor 2 family protein [Actinoplanes sp.]
MDVTELVDNLRTGFLSGRGVDSGLLADDVVIEWPFAAPGRPRRIEGRAAFEAMAGVQRAAMPFRLDEFQLDTAHRTDDPEVTVLEYRLGGVIAGERRSAAFVSVIRQRDGRIAHWREYQDTLAMTFGA